MEIADLKKKEVFSIKVLELNESALNVTASSFRAAYTVTKIALHEIKPNYETQ